MSKEGLQKSTGNQKSMCTKTWLRNVFLKNDLRPDGNLHDTHVLFWISLNQTFTARLSYGPGLWGIIHFSAGTFSLCSTQDAQVRQPSGLHVSSGYQWLKGDKMISGGSWGRAKEQRNNWIGLFRFWFLDFLVHKTSLQPPARRRGANYASISWNSWWVHGRRNPPLH